MFDFLVQIITVHVQIVFNVTNMTRKEPSVTVKVPRGKTNYELLDVAKLQNPCYAATYRKTSWGRSVMSICGVAKQPMLGYYWLTWVNDRKPHYGRDGKFRPKDGDFVTFRYIKITF